MKLAMALPAEPCSDWRLARQVGVEGAVFGLVDYYRRDPDTITRKGIEKLQRQLSSYDLELAVVEGDPVPLEPCRLGLPEGDSVLSTYLDLIRVLGDVGVKTMCPNWMAGINWVRTSVDTPIRGGALTTAFRLADLEPRPIDLGGVELTEEKLWDNLFRFLDRVLPVAEQSGVRLGFHPDDPPISPVLNVPRILTSYEAYERLFETYPSPSLGMTFCQGNVSLMDGDMYEMAERFGRQGKIFFVHFRDVRGDRFNFHETFHDEGPTDMARMVRIYERLVPDVPIRPDHVPTLEGDDNASYGYTMRGKLYAIGYIKGLMDACAGETVSTPKHAPGVAVQERGG
jgi:mannonate dehydratase